MQEEMHMKTTHGLHNECLENITKRIFIQNYRGLKIVARDDHQRTAKTSYIGLEDYYFYNHLRSKYLPLTPA